MAGMRDSISVMREMRNILAQNNYLTDFCTVNNFEDAVVRIFEELETFDDIPCVINAADLKTHEGHRKLFIVLINSTWHLIRRYRTFKEVHEILREERGRIVNNHRSLSNHVKKLKEIIEKKDNSLNEMQEKERQLKVKINNLTKEIKHEKEETLKLKKQIQSKEVQHTHEIRRIEQSGNKLRDQLQKTVGTHVPQAKIKVSSASLRREQEKTIQLCEQTIRRLEKDNSLLLQEINDLKEELTLRIDRLKHHMTSSGHEKEKAKRN